MPDADLKTWRLAQTACTTRSRAETYGVRTYNMLMNQLRLVVLLLSCVGSRSSAAEALFLPGDACFSSAFSDEILELGDNVFRLTYGCSSGNIGIADGYCGMDSLVIVDDHKSMIASTQNAYRLVRRSSPRRVEFLVEVDDSIKRVELNEVCVFIHNAGFRFEQFSPFMRFNENWVREGIELHPPNPLGWKTKPRISGVLPDLQHREWRDAELVPPLKHRNRISPEYPAEIECNANDLMLFLVSHDDLKILSESAMYERSVDRRVDVSSVRMQCVEQSRITELVFKDRRWNRREKPQVEDSVNEE